MKQPNGKHAPYRTQRYAIFVLYVCLLLVTIDSCESCMNVCKNFSSVLMQMENLFNQINCSLIEQTAFLIVDQVVVLQLFKGSGLELQCVVL